MDESKLNQHLDAYQVNSVYDLENFLTFGWYASRVTALSPSGHLLELGIGHGVATKILSSVYSRHLILEGSKEIIRSFREEYRMNDIEILEICFEDYDSDETFDVIVMGFILEHVDDPKAMLEKFKKFLKPDGRLYVSVPNAYALHRRIGFEAGLLNDYHEFNDYDRLAGHKRYFDSKSIEQLIKNAGYNINRIEGLFLKPITSNQMSQLNLSKDVMQAMLKVGVEYPELCNSVLVQASLPNLNLE